MKWTITTTGLFQDCVECLLMLKQPYNTCGKDELLAAEQFPLREQEIALDELRVRNANNNVPILSDHNLGKTQTNI